MEFSAEEIVHALHWGNGKSLKHPSDWVVSSVCEQLLSIRIQPSSGVSGMSQCFQALLCIFSASERSIKLDAALPSLEQGLWVLQSCHCHGALVWLIPYPVLSGGLAGSCGISQWFPRKLYREPYVCLFFASFSAAGLVSGSLPCRDMAGELDPCWGAALCSAGVFSAWDGLQQPHPHHTQCWPLPGAAASQASGLDLLVSEAFQEAECCLRNQQTCSGPYLSSLNI